MDSGFIRVPDSLFGLIAVSSCRAAEGYRDGMHGTRTGAEKADDLIRGKIGEVFFACALDAEGFSDGSGSPFLVRRGGRTVLSCAPGSPGASLRSDQGGRGFWDKGDITVSAGGRSIPVDVKAVKPFSDYLMIETMRYRRDGSLAYDNCDGTVHSLAAYGIAKVGIFPKNAGSSWQDSVTLSGWLRKYGSLPAPEKFSEVFRAEVRICGAASAADFWQKKHFAAAGMPCGAKYFAAVCGGTDSRTLVPPAGAGRTAVLQTDNYIADIRTLARPLKEVLVPDIGEITSVSASVCG